MPSTLRLHLSVDLADLAADLDSVELGLARELRKALRRVADQIAGRTSELMPRGPGPQNSKDDLPHIADTITGLATQTTATVGSDHPGAPVLNWGGTIAPRRIEIHFPHKHYAQQAGDVLLPKIEKQLQQDIDTMAATYLN